MWMALKNERNERLDLHWICDGFMRIALTGIQKWLIELSWKKNALNLRWFHAKSTEKFGTESKRTAIDGNDKEYWEQNAVKNAESVRTCMCVWRCSATGRCVSQHNLNALTKKHRAHKKWTNKTKSAYNWICLAWFYFQVNLLRNSGNCKSKWKKYRASSGEQEFRWNSEGCAILLYCCVKCTSTRGYCNRCEIHWKTSDGTVNW